MGCVVFDLLDGDINAAYVAKQRTKHFRDLRRVLCSAAAEILVHGAQVTSQNMLRRADVLR